MHGPISNICGAELPAAEVARVLAYGMSHAAPKEIAAGVRHAISKDVGLQQINWLIRKVLHGLRVYVSKDGEEGEDDQGKRDGRAAKTRHHLARPTQLVISVILQEVPSKPRRPSTP